MLRPPIIICVPQDQDSPNVWRLLLDEEVSFYEHMVFFQFNNHSP